MSSIIVLDSSDEDESLPKKANNKFNFDFGNDTVVTSASLLKNQNAKQRSIPSGITITPRLSPTPLGGKKGGGGSSSMQSSNSSSMTASFHALNNLINNERLTPTPPKYQVGSLNSRKRKTPTPPQSMPRLTAKNFATMGNLSPAKAATTLAPLPPIMPMITGVHSMAAAGATPPLQLMATPPHNMGGYMGLNEQLMINPHLIPSNLPPNTTITAHSNPNQNNINNNFKIHLPFNKPTTIPSPAASPVSSAPKTPSPAPSPQPTRSDKNTKRIKPTTLLKSSDESWQKHKQQSQRTPISLNNDVVIEMLPPSTESPKSTSASSSRYHTPMTSPTTPKSQKSPDVIMITGTDHNFTAQKNNETILDLTRSPEKVTTAKPITMTQIVDLVNTSEQKKHINGVDTASKENKNMSLLKGSETKTEKASPKAPLEPEYEELIKVCRQADSSDDMEKLIKSKLIKYYYEVHTDFVKSKSFRKNIRNVVESIKAKPDLVYYNLKTVVEELKVRRKARAVEVAGSATTNSSTSVVTTNTNEETLATNELKTPEVSATNTTIVSLKVPATSTTSSTSTAEIPATATTSTGNKKLDEQIKKLNKALYVLTKRIEVLEQTEVDWDDDDSSFLQVERFKKRACQIYEKICDLTGESKNAHRLVKKPIKFNETRIPQFNKTLQAFINRTKEFPDYYDVLRMLEHCNRTYSLGLVNFEMKNIAEDAFIKVGKLLQSRRKADLYETVTHYAGDGTDPAKSDPELAAKLSENLKNHKKINDILEKFARKQDMPDEEEEEKSDKTSNTKDDKIEPASVNVNTESIEDSTAANALNNGNGVKKEKLIKSEDNKHNTEYSETVLVEGDAEDDDDDDDEDEDEDEDDDEDEEDDEDDEENLDEQVETLVNGDISDNESDIEIISTKENENSDKKANADEKSRGSVNSDEEKVEESVDIQNASMDQKVSQKYIEIHNNTQKINIAVNDAMKNFTNMGNTPIIQIKSKTDSIYINNNNLDIPSTKTVINTHTSINRDKSLTPSSSPSTLLNRTLHVRNSKLKDATLQLVNSNNSTITPTLSNDINASIINTATVTGTTTTADLKIVHVSSLEPDGDVIVNDSTTINRRSEDGNSLSAEITIPSASKCFEEIVISDEES